MKPRLLPFICLFLAEFLVAQKHDYVWVAGDGNTLQTTTHGGMTINFNQNPVDVYYNYRKLNMFVCNASICDTSGNLIVYTNGCDIAGANDEILENGEIINPGLAHQVSCIENEDGYASGIQSAIFLQQPEADSIYYLFHKQIKLTINPTDAYTEKLLYSIVDMRSNNGVGKVVEKNIELLDMVH